MIMFIGTETLVTQLENERSRVHATEVPATGQSSVHATEVPATGRVCSSISLQLALCKEF
jgi:hypothetical protein